jgi:hypothetical protein
MAGIEFQLDSPEITISPISSREMNISNLEFRKKKLSIRITCEKKGCERKITLR